MKTVSTDLMSEIGGGIDSLRGAMGKIGGTCKDCHEDFHLKKD